MDEKVSELMSLVLPLHFHQTTFTVDFFKENKIYKYMNI